MKLISLTLENFKGVRRFDLQADGQDISILGDNGAGKTTLADAWAWLLFGKDSLNRAQFEIKTLDETGQALSHLDHTVEGVISVNGDLVSLKKTYKETYSRKRGDTQETFTGHTVDHFRDGVPMTKRDYDAYVSGIAEESTFRLLTDPAHFNQHLSWQDRRQVLISVCGDVTDADVIAADPELRELPGILGSRSIDDHRKVIVSRKAEINKQLQTLPARIDEVSRGMIDLTPLKLDAIQKKLAPIEKARAELAERITAAKAGNADGAAEKRQLRNVEDELAQLERNAQYAHRDAVAEAQRKASDTKAEFEAAERSLHAMEHQDSQLEREMQRIDEQLADLRTAWVEANARKLEAHTEDTCSACKQSLPADQVEAAHAAAIEQLNSRKATDLERIQADAAILKERRATLETGMTELRDQMHAERNRAITLNSAAEAALQAAEDAKGITTPDATQTPEYSRLAAQRDELQRQIASLETGDDTAIQKLRTEQSELDSSIHDYRVLLAQAEQRTAGQKRITELTEQERQLASEFEDLERQTHLLELFIRTKVSMLEGLINDRFKVARFKLFSEQVNGALSETCQTTVNGVPYDSLNHGMRVAVGLDIINTLAEHHAFAPPVFIDNSESVTELPATTGQQIRLVVSAGDKTLRIEAPQEVAA